MLLATRHLPPLIRHDRPAADREGPPRPAAADGRATTGGPAARSIWDEVSSFATIGVASTVAYVVLFAALRSIATAAVANAVALVVTAIGNTAANRRLTFRITGRETLLRDQAAGLAAFGLALAITTGAVGLLERLAPNLGRALEIAVLVAANGLATVARFVLLRTWISARRSHSATYDELEGSLS
jgi:putative flippase GtrA